MEAGENALSQLTPPIQPEVVVPAVKITETAEEEVPVDCKIKVTIFFYTS